MSTNNKNPQFTNTQLYGPLGQGKGHVSKRYTEYKVTLTMKIFATSKSNAENTVGRVLGAGIEPGSCVAWTVKAKPVSKK
jgi:hypothetical protein